ncbi:MAG TPA: aminotransferase class I/II-fold pyridoxal phosphate-dependent enzyme [Acidobacteriota bacterium]|nr:aminotransferase class I/II-fold pyridoxal phosphate-dependent enzyme [Acidobacteriota bacterium]HND21171.1 aminotransferase class I/II-fold pyridoxal phosphate-dependent enzyme [Acidobacteriota bacterium]HNG95287.1 aminotransferase class I/II-fold pyridoxal phosphate-dependent enzyme [Acidobacteriota bacterium]
MTRQANLYGAVNLAQGMPDFEAPQELKDAACQAIQDGFNQYAITWGAPVLRKAIAEKAKQFNGIDCLPDENITVCCGATEAMMAAMLALVNPGDEVIAFQPFYENYGPDGLLSGAKPVWVPMYAPDWKFDPEELRRAFGPKTKAIIINTPNNPTGRVFTREELTLIAELCQEHDVYALTDEIYEHIIYNDQPHISIATLPGMAERTVTISGLSKTYSVTGWRLGYCIAPREVTNGIRKVHDFLTVGAPHPLQVAGAIAMAFPDSYYQKMLAEYRERREVLLGYLEQAGFAFSAPEGAYYVMTDIAGLGWNHDLEFTNWLVKDIGVAVVPGSSFYAPPEDGRTKVRFMFAKKTETLHQAGERLLKLRK